MLKTSASLLALALGFTLLTSCAKKDSGLAAGPDFQKRFQEALIAAKPGTVIQLPEGRLDLDRGLSLSVDNVTIRGMGIEKTILSFKNQKTGPAGLQVTANGFTIEDLAIEDTKGDALKINGANGVTVRRVRTEWTGGPSEKNGSYGIYPVQCKNVLVEESVAIGAADAGIYVGQSSNIIVRRSRAEANVAGIEIENSRFADVYDNTATHNTGGILVFNLPDLPVKGGGNTRVFNNDVEENNTQNFGAKGSMVAKVPTGTGVIVLATNHVEVFKNTIKNNNTANVSVISYFTTGNPINDASYDPFPEAIYIHDNTISGGGTAPGGEYAEALAPVVGKHLPEILFDGVVNPKQLTAAKRLPEDLRICIQNNGDASFMNYDAGGHFKHISRDLRPYTCSLAPLSAVNLPAPAAGAPAGGN
ncbi:MAG TPA: parallel beta-helix domain-containing protein [Bryobacteraceae bacterium]|nr:parallel beta-helix domain-containing protein [Bryobacteraceae bacterium]